MVMFWTLTFDLLKITGIKRLIMLHILVLLFTYIQKYRGNELLGGEKNEEIKIIHEHAVPSLNQRVAF